MADIYQQDQGQAKRNLGWVDQIKKWNLYSVSILLIMVSTLFLISCSSGKSGSPRFTAKPNAAHQSVFFRNDHSQACNGWSMFNAGTRKRCIRK
jgi:hypothetical protein